MNEIIRNHGTGDSIEFLQTDEGTLGRTSEFIMTLAPRSSWAKSPRHFHPYQTETFIVLSGELNLTAGEKHHVLTPDHETVTVAPFTLHSFWNDTDEPVKFRAEIYPPKNIEKGLRLTYQLSQEGKINKHNIPTNIFHTLILMEYFDSYFAVIPWKLQRFLFRQGGKLARWMGYG